MTTHLTPMAPSDLARALADKSVRLVDIREPDEYAREHIPGAISLPLSQLEAANVVLGEAEAVVFHCKSGMRTNAHCARLIARVGGDAQMLAGGLDAWKAAGLPIQSNAKAPLEVMRQVQIIVGSMVLLGAILALILHPYFIGLSAFFGAGLLFAGVSGWCGMAKLLALLPWNKAGLKT